MSRYDFLMYKGQSLMFWALEWFKMSNDAFYASYGFNFNPHEYPGLYAEARERMYPGESPTGYNPFIGGAPRGLNGFWGER